MPNRDIKRVKFDGYGLFEITEAGKTVTKSTGMAENQVRFADKFRIIYHHTGEQRYVINNKEYDLNGGSLLIIRPGEWAGTGQYPSLKKTGYHIIFSLEPEMNFLGMTKEDSNDLYDILSRGKRIYRAGYDLKNIFNGILTFNKGKNALQSAWYKALLLELFCSIYRSCKEPPKAIPEPVILLSKKIDSNPCLKINFDRYASKHDMSPRKFKDLFTLYKGTSPSEYILTKKIEKADKMLNDTKLTITDIAFELNFSSSQHFATVYKKYRNMTPTEYRNMSMENTHDISV